MSNIDLESSVETVVSSIEIVAPEQNRNSLQVKAISKADLPKFGEPEGKITVHLKLDGETAVNWVPLYEMNKHISNLVDVEEVVLAAESATLLLSYPLKKSAVRLVHPTNSKEFTRGDLAKIIEETYREVYRLEAVSQAVTDSYLNDRGNLYNKPESDGVFGIWGHDMYDLSIAFINVYNVNGRYWIDPAMNS